MKTFMFLIVVSLVVTACMAEPSTSDETSELATASNASEIEQDPALTEPDSVCGLPTQCQPYACALGADGIAVCNKAFISDFICDSACGSLDAQCPWTEQGQINAEQQCVGACVNLGCANTSDISVCQRCIVSCMNNRQKSCQTGFGNA